MALGICLTRCCVPPVVCNICKNSQAPAELIVSISGWTNDGCNDCDLLNGNFVCTPYISGSYTPCAYWYVGDGPCGDTGAMTVKAYFSSEWVGAELRYVLWVEQKVVLPTVPFPTVKASATWKIDISVHPTLPDCMSIDEDIPRISWNGNLDCDGSPSCHVAV